MNATALIAEDEPLLAAALQAELTRAWPALQIMATVGDGASAVQQALALQPDVLFFDIRMPGMSGLEAAAELLEDWPEHASAKPFPQLVFVTAYDQYAVQAFEAQAVDYLLKPLQTARLQKTVQKVQSALVKYSKSATQFIANGEDDALVARLRQLLAPPPTHTAAASHPLRVIQASVGNSLRMVPIDEVLYLEAADKYLRVFTAGADYLIRTPLKELLPQLNPADFWQIHRGTVVRVSAIDTVSRNALGKLSLTLRGSQQTLHISRLYAHQFKAM